MPRRNQPSRGNSMESVNSPAAAFNFSYVSNVTKQESIDLVHAALAHKRVQTSYGNTETRSSS
jgi:hypothetical protein